jgi:hypothetical protein
MRSSHFRLLAVAGAVVAGLAVPGWSLAAKRPAARARTLAHLVHVRRAHATTPLPWFEPGPFSLRTVDAQCFYAPSIPSIWPVLPMDVQYDTHPVRGGFNDMRGGARAGAHIGIDIEQRDGAPVFAVVSGRIGQIEEAGTDEVHFNLGPHFQYWHATPLPGIHTGSPVAMGQQIGTVWQAADGLGMGHVHLTELGVPGCGEVDPRRPTGAYGDPRNTEAPSIGPLSAFVANAQAYAPFPVTGTRDISTPLRLDALSGVVDFRASVTDTPNVRTVQWPQQPLMVAAVRSFVAPASGEPISLGAPPTLALDGSRAIPDRDYYDVMAPGSLRDQSCFYGTGSCDTRIVLHVAGTGIDTRRLPNGPYQLCVEALTIEDVGARSCTPITIANAAAGSAA